MRLLVVTDIRLYRDALAAELQALPDVEHIEVAASGSAAVVAARRAECDVMLLDMALEGSTPIAVAVATARPGIRLVALGVKEDGPDVVACAEAGVAGYVARDAGFDDLVDALRTVHRGEVRCSGTVAAGLVRHISHQARLRHALPATAQLTRREREVLRLLEADMSNKEIARALNLQLSTVKNHVHNVLAKLGASGRAQIPGVVAGLDLDPVPSRPLG